MAILLVLLTFDFVTAIYRRLAFQLESLASMFRPAIQAASMVTFKTDESNYTHS